MQRQLTILGFLLSGIGINSCRVREHNAITERTTFKIIHIQPFTGITKGETDFVLNKIKEFYPHVLLDKEIALPAFAFYPPRNRYRADSLIRFLSSRTAEGHVTIGLTDHDISTEKNNIKDWGVMGLGFCPGRACIASAYRLTEANKNMQLFKVAIHELGHTEGLPHCDVKTCFMRDAEGKNTTDEEKEFCPRCKKLLIEKGWSF